MLPYLKVSGTHYEIGYQVKVSCFIYIDAIYIIYCFYFKDWFKDERKYTRIYCKFSLYAEFDDSFL